MYGTPVLGANIGGIPELIRVGETGELFESGNCAQLKKRIRDMWNAQERMKRYGEHCCNVHFVSLSQYTQKLLDYIEVF